MKLARENRGMSEYDYVFVGRGINAWSRAMLGKQRRTTIVLERNPRLAAGLRPGRSDRAGFSP